MTQKITQFRSNKQLSEPLMQMKQANEEDLRYRPDSLCNWRGNLTQEEMRESAKRCRQVHKVTAW